MMFSRGEAMRSESELRSLISRSQKDGFNVLFQQYYGYVYAVVWNRISGAGTPEDAEECVNDIFIEVFRQFDEIEPGKLHSYIGTVAKRRAINCFHRLTARPPAVSIEEQEMEMAVSEDSVEQDYDNAALRQVLLDKIRLLGEPDATIIMMKYFYEYDRHILSWDDGCYQFSITDSHNDYALMMEIAEAFCNPSES